MRMNSDMGLVIMNTSSQIMAFRAKSNNGFMRVMVQI